jgi:hypothetical protein
MGYRTLDDFEQQEDEDDGEDKANASAAVVSEPRSHAVTTEAEHEDQNDQKDKHLFLRSAKIRRIEGVMRIFEVAPCKGRIFEGSS